MKITFANILADVCCKLPNGDVDKVTQAMGSDTRIGNKYLTGGTGYGGPCFPRDVRAFSYILRRYESFSSLPDTINLINKDLSSNLINVLLKTRTLTFGQTIGVLGLAYKPGTPVVEESQSIKFIKEYFEHPAFSQDKIIGYDPLANENAKIELKNYTFFKTVDSVEECITKSDILIVMTPEECFKYTSVDFSESNSPYQVIDLWRLFEDRFVGEDKYVVMYVPWGKEWTQWWLM
jgi:UDPglucose 6-dehydrogenase